MLRVTFVAKDWLVASLGIRVVRRGLVVSLRTLSVAMVENFVVARPRCVAQGNHCAPLLWTLVNGRGNFIH